PFVSKEAGRHDWSLVLSGEVENLACPGRRFADRLVAEGRQTLGQGRSDQIEMIVSVARRVAQPYGIDLANHFFRRPGNLDAGERLGEILGLLRVGVEVVRELGVGERPTLKGEVRVANVPPKESGRAGIDEIAKCIEVNRRVQVLRKVPGMPVARLR